MTDSPQLEPNRRRTRASGLLALAIAAAAMLALSLFLASRSATPTVLWLELRTVSGDRLVSSGITLLPPPPGAETSAVPQTVAEQVAADQWPGVAIKELELFRVIELSRVPPMDQLAWVVSLDPAAVGVPTHGLTFVNDLAIMLVDAQTGAFLGTTVVSHIVDP